jgi:thiosulfate/3-mercaptopyruvate sulfurtransferase
MKDAAKGPAREGPCWDGLVDVASLHGLLGSKDLCVIDCRYDLALADAGSRQYEQGHIPGAVYADLGKDLSGPKTPTSGRHPLPHPDTVAGKFRAWGIGSTTQVVVYDASQGSFAARAWWLLRWVGHSRAALLDGGWQAWTQSGFPVTAAVPSVAEGSFRPGKTLQTVTGIEEVAEISLESRRDASRLIVDARAADRYEGRNESVDPVAGHIPGAQNRPWAHNLGADGRFKPAEQLRAEYENLLAGRTPEQVTMQCGSGVTACHNLLAMHVAGMAGASLFPGSWSQWIKDPKRSVATGSKP